ncbi:MAG TPA: tRNA pseudouridine(55) synthase TruB [Kosmotogaceae bacterium]|nr:tRNA pseudouridine(55) synthase TruB [Kosmotogaceae bacterium]
MTSDVVALVCKDKGLTSHDAVDLARRKLGIRKIGHSGTLDPFATGLLILGIGKATRLLEYFKDLRKTYRAKMRLGVITDTYDITGNVVEERKVDTLSKEMIEETLKSFLGKQMQVPPAYSARKHQGQRLYKMARQGKIMNLPPREVEIFSIELIHYDETKKEVDFSVTVSAGTYIRSLVMDFGYKLETGATATELVRTEIGMFSLESAVPVDKLDLSKCLSLSEATSFIPAMILNDSAVNSVILGSQVYAPMIAKVLDRFSKGQIIRLLDRKKNLVAIAKSERTSKFILGALAKASGERVATLVKVLRG